MTKAIFEVMQPDKTQTGLLSQWASAASKNHGIVHIAALYHLSS